MAELIDALDDFNYLDRYAYFTVCFNQLASTLAFGTPLDENKENMAAVIENIDVHSQEMEVIFKHWRPKNRKDADVSKDYPYQYLWKSKSKNLIVWACLDYKGIDVEMLYDSSDQELEQWVISTNHRLRTKFGYIKVPVFKVLSKDKGDFRTQNVTTENFEADIQKIYNDDFMEINEIIEESLKIKKAGLILFHGVPGTGKTSYIKHLINKFKKKKFIFIQNEFINELLHPDFISFLLKNKNAVLVIEDAEKVLINRDQMGENSVVSTILQLTDGLFSDYLNIKIICTFNTSIDKIDQALLRKGRMIAYYEFQALTPPKASELLKSMNHESTNTPMTLADIYNYQKKNFNQAEKGKIGFNK
jgi:hypothetical protein